MAPNGSKPTPLKITSADNHEIAIEAGGYYYNTKARCQRIMRESLSPEAGRVHACLELATMGFHQELAVKLDRGRKVPLTPTDVAQQTGLTKQHTRRALAELENAGLAERRAADEGPLRRGKVLLFSWALPHKPKAVESSHRAATNFGNYTVGLPASWEPLTALSKRLKLEIDPEKVVARQSLIEEGEEVARNYLEAEKVAARFLERVRAKTTKPASKSVGRKIVKDRTTHTPAAPSAPAPADHTTAAAVVRVLSPPSKPPEQPAASSQNPKPAGPSLHRVEEFVRRYPGPKPDPDAIRREYLKSNTPETEAACHACLDRYLASDQVHRQIFMNGDRWLRQQARNNWEGQWTPVKRRRLDQLAADYARRRREEKGDHGD